MPAPKRRTTRRRSPQPKRILNVRPSEKTEQDYTFEHAARTDAVVAAATVPPSKDLRAAWWKINDQGSTGSCVGLGDRRRPPALAPRPGGAHQEH